MSNFLIGIAVFVITVVAALFAVPYAIDWNGYRGVFEEEASRMLGREVRVGGAVNLHFLPTPYFSLERVRIADATGGLQEPFFRTESVTIKLAIPPLLRGAVEANEVEFRRPVLRLAVDDKGNWNWQSFIGAFRDAAYMPSSVSITSLVITDGMLALHGANGQERTRFENIGADLSSTALEGPYRVRATYGAKGAERDLRLATAAPEQDGSVRVKASIRAQDTASTYGLDAKLTSLMGAARLEGELTARLPFGGLWPTQTRAITDEAFELRSLLSADANGLQLRNLALSFEQGGQPQTLSGELSAQWRGDLDVDAKLASPWLDLDRIGGVSGTGGPLDSIVPFAQRLRDLLPQGGRARARLSVEQANIGREATSGLSLALAKSDERVVIEELRAGVPGGARVEVTGVVTGPTEAPRFAGALNLRGASLARFAGWASAGALSSEGRTDGTFGVRASLAIEPGFASLKDIAAEISGNAVQGSASYRWGTQSEISLRLEGPQIDARTFIPAGADLNALVALLKPSSGPSGPQAAGHMLETADLALRISTGALLTGGQTYRDVTVAIERKGANLKVPLLRLSGDDGFSIDLDGEVDGGARQKGALRLVAAADTPAALRPLAELVGIPEALRPGEARFQALAPLRIAANIAVGARTATSFDISGDGEANGGTLRFYARLDGSASGWRGGPADVLVSIDNPDAQQVAALLLPATGGTTRTDVPSARTAESGRMLLRAAGVPGEGIATLFSLTANETAVAFDGRFTASDDAPRLIGNIDIAGADAGRIAALARLSPPLRLGSFPLNGTMKIATDGSTLNVERLTLDMGGGTILNGRLGIAPEGAAQRVNAELEAGTLGLAQLLSPALDNRIGAATAAAEAALNERASSWPGEPFELRGARTLVGDISLKARRLQIDKDLALSDAQATVQVGDGRILVRQLEGIALGGRWATAFSLQAQPQGMELSGTLQAEDINLAKATAGAKGTANVKASFRGVGASPRALVAALQGQASVTLNDAAIPGLSPSAVSKAVDAGIGAASDSVAKFVRAGVLANLATPALPLPPTLTAEITDGFVRFKPASVEMPAGTAAGSASVDLGALTYASDWKLTDKLLSSADRQLPAVSVHYRGALGAIGRVEPAVGTDALEREVSVRKMERDVDELERLRKLDEARRREDSERLREQIEKAPPPSSPQAQPQATPTAPQQPAQPRPQAQQKAPSLKSLLPSWLAP